MNFQKQVPKLEAELSDVVAECEEYMIARQKRWSAASLWHGTNDEEFVIPPATPMKCARNCLQV